MGAKIEAGAAWYWNDQEGRLLTLWEAPSNPIHPANGMVLKHKPISESTLSFYPKWNPHVINQLKCHVEKNIPSEIAHVLITVNPLETQVEPIYEVDVAVAYTYKQPKEATVVNGQVVEPPTVKLKDKVSKQQVALTHELTEPGSYWEFGQPGNPNYIKVINDPDSGTTDDYYKK